MLIEEFKKKVKEKFNGKIIVKESVYKGYDELMLFRCLEHGEFSTTPKLLLKSKYGCKECAFNSVIKFKQVTEEEFLNRCNIKFKDKFNYKEGEFVDYDKTPMKIICPVHGETWQVPKFHLKSKHGCQLCAGFKNGVIANKKKKTTEEFINEAKKVYQIDDDFSKVDYYGAHKKIIITCPKHGDFEVTPSNYLSGNRGCKQCALEAKREKMLKTHQLFVEEARKIHGDFYIYNDEYKGKDIPIAITCPKHGIFYQRPSDHIQNKSGCPLCMESHLERRVRQFLDDNNILYIYEQTFDWLVYKRKLSLDFYLPEYNVAIECQGIQHFKPTSFFGSLKTGKEQNDKFNELITRDKIKKELCEKHNIKILYFTDLDKDEFLNEKLIKDEKELLIYVGKESNIPDRCS